MENVTQEQTQPIPAAPAMPRLKQYTSPARLLAIATASVFAAEFLVMLCLMAVPPLPPLVVALIDAVLMTGLVFPALYVYLWRPMLRHMAERDRAEQALVESERRFRAIFNQSFQFIGLLQPDGTVLEANQTALDFGGLTHAEVVGRLVWETPWWGLSADTRDRLKAAVAGAARGEFVRYEDEVPGANGAMLTIDFSLKPVKDDRGQVVLLITEGRDISMRKQAEQALQKAHDELELRVQERTAELWDALETSRRGEAEVAALLSASRAVQQYRDFAQSARSIFDTCKDLIGASAGYIALVKNDVNQVVFLDAGGYPCSVDPDLPMPIRGLREQAYRTGKALYENDFSHSRWTQFLPAGHTHLDNVLFAPLVIQGFVVGLLGLANKPGGFTEDDARMASACGEIAAVAFLNSRTMELLETSEERFRSVAQTASEAMITVDVRGEIIFWNRAAEHIFGYAADEVAGQPLTLIMPERFGERHQQGMARLASTGQPSLMGKTVELVGLRRDACEFPIELSLSTWQTREGVFFTGIIRDITDRKQAEEALEEYSRKLNERVKELDCLYSISEMVWRSDLSQGEILQASVSILAQTYRFPEITACRLTWGEHEYSTENFRETPWSQNRAILIHGEQAGTIQVCYLEERPEEDEGPFLAEERNLINAVADVLGRSTERKQAEEALHESEERFRLAINATREGLWEWNIQTNQEFFAPRWCEIIGYAFDDPELPHTYNSWASRIHPDDYDRVMSALNNHLEKGAIYDVDYRHRHKSGEYRWQNSTGQAVFDESGKPTKMVGCISDITERKRAEAEIEHLASFPRLNPHPILEVDASGAITFCNPATIERLSRLGRYGGAGYGDARVFLPLDIADILHGRTQLKENPLYREATVHGLIFGEFIHWAPESDAVRIYAHDVTARKRAEEVIKGLNQELEGRIIERTAQLETANQSLRASEARYRIVADNTYDWEFWLDPEGQFIYSSPSCQRITGYAPDEYMRDAALLQRILHPEDAARFQRHRLEVERGVASDEIEFRIVRSDGTLGWIGHACQPVVDSEGRFAGTRGSNRDITERKRAEEALRQANAYNRSLIETSLDPLVTVGPDGKITDVNLATEAATGCSRAELVGTDFAEYFSEPGLARAGYQEAFRAGSVRDYALELLHRDGRVTSVLYNACVYRDEAGHVTGVFAAARDITARKQAEERLRLQSAALEAAANGIIITDRQGNIQWCNPAFVQMTGYAVEQLLGRNPRFLQSGHHSQEFYRQLWETILAGQVWRGEMTNKRKDGSLYLEEQTISPVRNERGELAYFVAIKQDSTQRKRAEDEIKRRNQELATLNEIGRAITSTLDLDHVLAILLEHARRVADASMCAVGLIEAATGEVVFHEPVNRDTAIELTTRLRLKQGEGIAGWVIGQRHSALIADVSADPRARLQVSEAGGLTSMACVPLIARDAVIGIISLLDERVGAFAEQDIRLLESVAAQAAIAIHNARLYEAEQQARQIAEILCDASVALTQTLNLNAVLDALLNYVGQLVPYDSAAVILLEGESRLVVQAERGYERWTDPEQIRAMTFDTRTDPIARVLIEEQKSVLIPDTREQPGWERRPGIEHIRSWLGVPLAVEGKVIGLCGLDKTEPGYFTQGHVQLAEALVGQAAVAVQNAWLFEQVRAGRERLHSLSHRLVQTQETERAYIARELHDEAGQSLTTLLVGLRLLKDEANQPEAIAAGVDELSRMVDGVLEDLHRLAMDLRPASLDHLGLVTALRQHINAVSRKHGLIAGFETAGLGDERLLPAVETNLYRIVQEALTNIVRYARATRVDVLLERRGDQVTVAVKDNGVGFDPSTVRAQDGRLGLFGMQERAEMLGGTLAVESVTGVGTTISVEVPYDDTRTHYR